MTEDGGRDSHLEIAHVLFIDIVGYSKLLTNEQRERQQELNRLVRDTWQFRAAEAEDKLVRIPTGDEKQTCCDHRANERAEYKKHFEFRSHSWLSLH